MPASDPRTPNLFVAGVPKAGTTFLHYALDRVPDVFMSSVKEPGFFTSAREQRRGFGYYLDAYFAKAAGFPIRGESTPWYVYSDAAREQIARIAAPAAAKVVLLLRRPSDRALSMYRDQVRLNREVRSFTDAVDAELRGLDAGDLVADVRQRYVWGGLYHQHLQSWVDDLGSERVHVIVLEELTARPEEAWVALGRFLDHDLGPSRLAEVDERDRNPSSTLRWPRVDAFLRSFEGRENPLVEGAKRVLPPGLHRRVLQRVGRINRTTGGGDAAGPHAGAVDALDEWYRSEVARVEAFLGRGLPSWQPLEAPAPSPREAAPRRDHIRILHLVARSHRRGAELVAVELADELDRRGHQNHVVALGPALTGGHELDLIPLAESRGVGVPELIGRVRRVRALLRDPGIDVVLAHGGWAAQIAALATPRDGPLLVWQRILGFPESVWRPERRWWWRAVARRFDVCVALTTELEGELRRLGFEGAVWVIPNARKPERFLDLDRARAAARLRSEISVAPDVPLIGFVGHLVRQKRPERALGVLQHVRAAGQAAHLVVAGDGGLRSLLEREIRDRGLGGSVTLLGHRSDVEWVFGGVDVAILTSEAEGIPGVAIESLMAGCPLVSFPTGGIDEVVDDGVTGVVLPAADDRLMAEAVRTLLADEPTRLAMGRAGRLQTTRFSASTTAAAYADRLLDALRDRTPAPGAAPDASP